MLICDADYALVIPYLTMIILKLNDHRRVRDHDVEAMQPFPGIYYGAAVRRAANILLALK